MSSPRWNSQPTYAGRTCGKEKIQLLRAPSIESDVMWKQQCFEMVYNRLRSKLSDYSDDVVISVFNEHFPLSTITAGQEARRIVHAFRNSFSDVENLTPTAFLDRNGNNQPGKMYKTPRPSNICHIGIRASISMESLSEAFDKNSEFILKYYLEFPQSFYAADSSNLSVSQPCPSQIYSVIGNAADMDLIFFIPKNQNLPHHYGIPYPNEHPSLATAAQLNQTNQLLPFPRRLLQANPLLKRM